MSVIVSEYLVLPEGCEPDDWDAQSHYGLRVVRRGIDRYAVLGRMGQCLRHDGRRWAYESLPSSRTERFKRAYRMSESDALALAVKAVEKYQGFGYMTFREFQAWRVDR